MKPGKYKVEIYFDNSVYKYGVYLSILFFKYYIVFFNLKASAEVCILVNCYVVCGCHQFSKLLSINSNPNKKRNRQVDWVLDKNGNNMLQL